MSVGSLLLNKFARTSELLLLIVAYYKFDVGLAFSGVIFVTRLMKTTGSFKGWNGVTLIQIDTPDTYTIVIS
jgi:hypothetical protein